VILVLLVGYQMLQKEYIFQLGDFPILVARFQCAILLHIQLQKEVTQSIQMMKYLANHHE
jgi:hypothetical protein